MSKKKRKPWWRNPERVNKNSDDTTTIQVPTPETKNPEGTVVSWKDKPVTYGASIPDPMTALRLRITGSAERGGFTTFVAENDPDNDDD